MKMVGKNDKEQARKIHPSIFIGLGGTGKHVLLNLRRKFFEKFGLKEGFPIMGFKWLDTDMQNIGIDGKKLDYALEQVMLKSEDIIDLQIPDEEFRTYLRYKQDNRHIWEWLPHTIEKTGAPKNGAKQIRPLGRLGFFNKYNKIVRDLKALKERVCNIENVKKTRDLGLGMEVDTSRIEIYLIFSVAGGTGSGIFLDTAFTLKDEFAKESVNSIGYIVLPAVFSHDTTHRIYANSYAALKELDFYSLRKDYLDKDEAKARKTIRSQHDFKCWYWESREPKYVMGPPFDIAYIIDNKTSQGYNITVENKNQLLDMISEDIFLKFASPIGFGSIIKSIQTNEHAKLEGHYQFELADETREGEIKHSNAYSIHYASMGLAKIYIPIEKIRKACGLKLAMAVVKNWTKKPGKDPNINNLVEKEFYAHLKFSRGETGKTFISNINRCGERTYEATIDSWINSLRNRFLPKIETKGRNIRKQLVDAYEQYVKENIEAEGGRKGIFVQGIETNITNLVKEIKERILEETNRVLDLPQFRFEVARKVLLHFKERLQSMKKALQNQANETRTKLSGKYQREYTSALNTYSDVERRFHLLKTTTLVKQGSFIIKAMRDKLINEVRVLLLEGAVKVIDDICGFVGFSETKKDEKGEIIVVEKGWVKKLTEVEEILKTDILGSFDHKYDFFSRQEAEHINTSLYHKELIQYYYEIDGEPISDETILATGKEFLSEEKMEMIMLGDYFEKYGKARIEQALEDYCQAKFTRMAKKHEVIKMLYDESTERGYTPEERQRKISAFVGNGHPWINHSGGFLGIHADRMKKDIGRYSILGVFPGEHGCYETFKNDIKKEKKELYLQLTDSEEHVAYFYTEWVAFPLMYVDGINKWYDQAYIDYLGNGEENLHIEKYYHKYDELIAISHDELDQYLSAYGTLILGFMLGIVEINEVKERNTFKYHMEMEVSPGIFRQEKLGDEYFAVRKIQRNSALRQNIANEIVKKKNEIEMNHQKMWNFYALLVYYWRHVFPIKYKGTEADPVPIKTFEHRVIEDEMKDIGNKIKDKEDKNIREDEVSHRLAKIDEFSGRIGNSSRRVIKF
jgi:hypothetical protein